MLTTLRQRNFTLLWLGATISMIGDWMLFIGLPVYIYSLTGSTLATGITFMIEIVPNVLLSSVAGVFVDRWNRKRVMVAADLLRALAVLLLLAVGSTQQVWLAYIAALIMSIASQFANPAESALIPQLVDEAHLVAANSLNSLSVNLTRLIGPTVGGALIAVLGFNSVVLIDSASFLLSGLLISLIAVRSSQPSAPAAAETQAASWISVWREWWSGLQFVRQDRTIVAIFLIIGAVMPAEGILRVEFVSFIKQLGGGAWEYGLIASAQAIGGLIASLAITRVGRAVPAYRLVGMSGVINGLLLLAIFNFRSLPIALVLFVLAGFPVVGFFVSLTTLLQTNVPDQYRGRVFGAFGTTIALMTLLGMGIASALGDLLGTSLMLNIVASLNVLAGLLAFLLLQSVVAKRRLAIEPEIA
jgi:MFS family permease